MNKHDLIPSELPPTIEAFELSCFFSETPQRVLLVLRTYSDHITAIAVALAEWLQTEWSAAVCVEYGAAEGMYTFVNEA